MLSKNEEIYYQRLWQELAKMDPSQQSRSLVKLQQLKRITDKRVDYYQQVGRLRTELTKQDELVADMTNGPKINRVKARIDYEALLAESE